MSGMSELGMPSDYEEGQAVGESRGRDAERRRCLVACNDVERRYGDTDVSWIFTELRRLIESGEPIAEEEHK